MSNIGELINRLVYHGLDADEAGEIIALAVAAGAATAPYRRSAAAVRQKAYRDRVKGITKRNESVTPLREPEHNETVTNRNESVTPLREPEHNETVTNRNESVTRYDPTLSIEDNKKKKRESRATQLPDGWRPGDAAWMAAVELLGEQRSELELVKFRNHAADKGRTSKNWDAAWRTWFGRAIEYGAPVRGGPHLVAPVEVDWEAQVSRFLKGHAWSAKWYGPEPGQLGCRVPPEILLKHGITQAA